MLLFDLTTDRGASVCHMSQPKYGRIRIGLKFNKALPETITCLLYLEFENSVLTDIENTVAIDI